MIWLSVNLMDGDNMDKGHMTQNDLLICFFLCKKIQLNNVMKWTFFLLISKGILNYKWWQSENAISWTYGIGVEQIGNLALKMPHSTLTNQHFDLWIW